MAPQKPSDLFPVLVTRDVATRTTKSSGSHAHLKLRRKLDVESANRVSWHPMKDLRLVILRVDCGEKQCASVT